MPDGKRQNGTCGARFCGRLLSVLLTLQVCGCVSLVRIFRPRPARPLVMPRRGALWVGALDRTFAYYVPARLAPHPPLLLAFHGTHGTGMRFRRRTAYGFDRLADEHGFVVVYPDGFEGHWNDCRKAASYSARTLNVDDVGFVRALVAHFQANFGVDPGRVFATGFSNGGQMSFRLALEAPDAVRAVAAISASLPTAENLDCRDATRAVSVLAMNGTEDPLNPYEGGRVTVFGFGNRGDVRSALDTARYFASRLGGPAAPSVERVTTPDATPWVERATWRADASQEVALVTIHGGGHVVPQHVSRYPGFLGPTAAGFDGPTEIWRFFERQMRASSPPAQPPPRR